MREAQVDLETIKARLAARKVEMSAGIEALEAWQVIGGKETLLGIITRDNPNLVFEQPPEATAFRLVPVKK